MTPDQDETPGPQDEASPFSELLDAVIAVAAAPPLRHDPTVTFSTKVPWARIERLREALDAAGIEWRPR